MLLSERHYELMNALSEAMEDYACQAQGPLLAPERAACIEAFSATAKVVDERKGSVQAALAIQKVIEALEKVAKPMLPSL